MNAKQLDKALLNLTIDQTIYAKSSKFTGVLSLVERRDRGRGIILQFETRRGKRIDAVRWPSGRWNFRNQKGFWPLKLR